MSYLQENNGSGRSEKSIPVVYDVSNTGLGTGSICVSVSSQQRNGWPITSKFISGLVVSSSTMGRINLSRMDVGYNETVSGCRLDTTTTYIIMYQNTTTMTHRRNGDSTSRIVRSREGSSDYRS